MIMKNPINSPVIRERELKGYKSLYGKDLLIRFVLSPMWKIEEEADDESAKNENHHLMCACAKVSQEDWLDEADEMSQGVDFKDDAMQKYWKNGHCITCD